MYVPMHVRDWQRMIMMNNGKTGQELINLARLQGYRKI